MNTQGMERSGPQNPGGTRLEGARRLRIGLAQFPGSNCDVDCIHVLKKYYGIDLVKVWHTEPLPSGLSGLILPGGFSYGDYLRGGALASHSPLMSGVASFVKGGGAVIGICNGFQILTEARLLPGILLRNESQKFICRFVKLAAEAGASGYHQALAGRQLSVPIAHGEGRYYVDPGELPALQRNGQVLFRYVGENPNGATDAIAGITDPSGRVMGMMPHPERACDPLLGGGEDGLLIWDCFIKSML